jgi:hypothetical protein
MYNIDEKFSITPNKKYNKKCSYKINNSKETEKNNENIIANIFSYSSENDSKGNENTLKAQKNQNCKDDNNMNFFSKQNKCNYCLCKIRRKIDIIKNNIKCKNYNDDSRVNISFKKDLDDNYRIKCAQNYINKLKLERKNEYNHFRNKTISFYDINRYKPPILGFLQKNEISSNLSLSSCNLSGI